MAKAKQRQQACPAPKGILVIIGGKENKGEEPGDNVPAENYIKLEVLKTFVDLINKKKATIAVITTSSGLYDESFAEYKKLLAKLGVDDILHIHHESRAEALENPCLEEITRADAVFFVGGDQLSLTSVYGGTEFLKLLKERYIREPLIIGGTSAGAMALSTPMIYAGNKDVEQTSGEIKVTTGLEFLKDVCVDTHFVHRGRFVRMAQVIVTNPTCLGVGIEEDTALVIRNGLEAQVIGSGTVLVMDGLHITASNIKDFAEKKAISIRNIRVHILSRNDTYALPQMNPPHQ